MDSGIGIVGFAHGHVGAYCHLWKDMEGVRLVAGWDHDGQRAVQSCQGFGMPHVEDLDSLLGNDKVKAVVIAAETSMHADLAVRAAEAGKAIVLQKPMALTLEAADRIIEAVETHEVPFTMAWQMRVDPQNVQMKHLIEDGVLGRIYMIRRRHCLATQLFGNFEDSWHVKRELNRGMWADDAAHPIDFIYWLFGMPKSVSAEIDTLRSSKVPDDHGIAIFRYADGLFAEVSCSFVAVAGENTTEIVGEKGVLIQNYGDGPSCGVPRPADAPGLKWYLHEKGDWTYSDIPSPKGHGERIAGLAVPLLEFLRGERPSLCSAREGRDSLAMVLASYQAAEVGRRVAMASSAASTRA